MMMMQAQEPAVAMKLPDSGDLQQPSQPVVLPGRHQKAPAEQLKCPRCESPNTKFCYYNNYSLTQPRYFCKNCRRYWTKGGSLRNVPVGGGCRKNKRVNQKPPQRSIDDTTASVGGAGLFCSSGLGPGGPFSTLIPPPNYPGNLPNPNSPFGLTFACLQESLIRSTDFNTYTNPNPLNSFVKTELVHNNNHNHNHNDPNSLSLLLDNYTSAASSVNQSLHAKPCAQPQSPFKLNLQQPKVAMQLQEEHHNNQQHQQQLMHPIFERSMQDHHNNMQEPSLFLQDAIAQNTSSHSFWVGNNNNDTTPGWPEFFPLSGP